MRFRRTVATAALTVAVVGTGVGVSQCNNPPPPGACQPDPSAAIAALPSGGTFTGTGNCYTVPNGIVLTKPVTIDGGTFNDPSNTLPAKGDIKPIIKVLDTSDVTIANVSVVGANVKGAYSPTLAKGAGFSVLSSSNVTLTNDSSANTYGDGLYLMGNFPQDKAPDSNVTVTNLSVTNAGRNGLTPADVTDSTITDLHVSSSALDDIDFESDLGGVGAGNLNFVGGSWLSTHVSETLTGPMTFTGSSVGRVFQTTSSTVPAPYTVTFAGGSLQIPTHSAGIGLKGPVSFVFSDESFTRQTGNQPNTQPAWNLRDGAHLTIAASTIPPPTGTADASSVVTVTP